MSDSPTPISTYPFFVFNNGAKIPPDYYTPLLTQTDKPLAIAEGGFSSQPIGAMNVTAEDQVGYLNSIHTQLGPRLVFWVNTRLNSC